jgi:SAM-dependent methyltransferase
MAGTRKGSGKARFGAGYWDSVVTESKVVGSEEAWREHMQALYRGLQARWGENAGAVRVLKTDLYDEAISPHGLLSLLGGRCDRIVGTDVSLEIARAAKRRIESDRETAGRCAVSVSDARSLAFRSCVFDEILSNSTLDHFPDKADITASLKELHRVLRPGGTLTITLDNPWNPVVFVRNLLPYPLLRSLGVIPFSMGKTLSRPALARALEASGFRVCESTAIAHFPRIVAIRVGRLLERSQSTRARGRLLGLMSAFERLARLPTRYVTGYYVAVRAVKA